MNSVTLKGILGRDPDMRYTGNGTAVAVNSLAVKKEFEKDGEKREVTNWIELKAWRDVAEKMAKAPKGAPVYVIGELTSESWDDKETGKKRSKLLVTVLAITSAFSGPVKKSEPAEAPTKPGRVSKPMTAPTPDDGNDDVPF